MDLKTIKVKPWGDGQGDFVVINESDFDPDRHELFDAPAKSADLNGDGALTAKEIRAALDAKGITYKSNASKADLLAALEAAK